VGTQICSFSLQIVNSQILGLVLQSQIYQIVPAANRKSTNFYAVAGFTVFASIPAFDGVHTVLAVLLLLYFMLLLAFLLCERS
jgi:hypothetical protein